MAEKKKRERPSFNRDVGAAIAKHYEAVHTKRPLGYALMAGNPLIEVAYAAGIQPAFPENFACASASGHASAGYCECAEAHGYSPDICSYCRNHLGYIYQPGESPPNGGIDEPDLFLLTTAACTHYFKWWDTLHEMYHKPLICINVPRLMERFDEPDFYMDYAMRQMERAIAKVEEIVGVKITNEKLSEVVRLSDEVVNYWQKLLELQKAVPCPMDLSDLSNALFVLIVLAGTQEGADLMRKIYNETKQRVTEGKGILSKEEEKHRLVWLNIPFWYKLGIFGRLEDRGCVFPFSDYTSYIWGVTRMDNSKPIESLARKALVGELNTSVDHYLDNIIRDIKEYHVDGVIAHSNRSCRVESFGMLDAVKIIGETVNIPTLVLDCDHTDERIYSDAEVMNMIDGFLEMLD